MALPNIKSEDLHKALKALEQANYNHDQWTEALYSTMICHLAPDERDTVVDAHRRCRFGQWYYEIGMPILGEHPGFDAIGMEHERMHHFATNLLRSSISDEKVEIENYEHFVTARKRLLLETGTLHHEIQEALYNLDPLTGTTSRIGMLIQLREQQELVKRDVHSCAVAMMDLDHFNTINGKYGHLVGDKVLIAIAESVMAHLRPYDKIFRCGGEEFLISLPNTDLQTAHKIIDRLREDLGSLPHQANTGATFHVAVSFGVTLLAPDISVEQSIYRADKALHVAKEMGRNRTLTWDASMDVL